jgi:hypothetical protein
MRISPSLLRALGASVVDKESCRLSVAGCRPEIRVHPRQSVSKAVNLCLKKLWQQRITPITRIRGPFRLEFVPLLVQILHSCANSLNHGGHGEHGGRIEKKESKGREAFPRSVLVCRSSIHSFSVASVPSVVEILSGYFLSPGGTRV